MLSGWMAVLYRTELLGQGTQLCPAVLLHPFIAGRLEADTRQLTMLTSVRPLLL
jgi:hypothetical protein